MGGTSLTNGADCSGFVQTVYATYGISLPRTTTEQSVTGTSVAIESIEVGDIISYGYEGIVTHSAIYIGNGMIVHASTPELGIRIDNMYIMPILAIRSVI
ncbi:MAG: C40 family peptidase [Bacilli bacterium]|nr:C40 family peptidase [Bacilli bacterium]